MNKIIVTGAGGFVGLHFVEYNKERYQIKTLSLKNDNWKQEDLRGYDAVVHLAGKAHEMNVIDDQIYYTVNTELTKQLFEKTSAEGVSHFIYISSTKVYGDDITTVLTEQSPYAADDAYGKSKQQAEEYLLGRQSANQQIAIVRPPLVYGPGVKGNMIKMLRLCAKKIPLPFGSTGNRRSMVYVLNLVALINTIIDKKAGGVFVAGDAQPLSTTELVSGIRGAMNRKPGLISIPGLMRRIIKKIKPGLYTRLFGSFEVNNSLTNNTLSFTPPFSSRQGMEAMVQWYLKFEQK
jgi:nucleoside-diphosphate-sugar epimerase